MNNRKLQCGQMLVIIMLVMVVGLSIGLFLISRTSTDISLTARTTDSARSFNAAEAGIEEAMKINSTVDTGIPVLVAPGTTYTVSKTDLGGSEIYPSTKQAVIPLGEVFTVWMIPHNSNGTLNESGTSYSNNNMDICFTGNTPAPAIGVTLYYKEGGIYKSSYAAYDPVPAGGRPTPSVNFNDIASNAGLCDDAPNNYNYRIAVKFGTDFRVNLTPSILLIALRIRPIYSPSAIAVIPQGGSGSGNSLPKQGDSITSVGNAGETSRKIQVNDPYIVPAPFLDNAIYSKTDLVK